MDQDVNNLSKNERRRLRKEQERQENLAYQRKQKNNKLIKVIIGVTAGLVILGGIIVITSNFKTLPPTDIEGHIEQSLDSHIVSSPMDIRVHKHMLEHADGDGPPGVIINYDCENYDCDLGLIDKLAQIVNDYPENVYLAPFPNMAAKIVLTRYNQQETLDDFDEEKIKKFIEK